MNDIVRFSHSVSRTQNIHFTYEQNFVDPPPPLIPKITQEQGVCYTRAWPFTLKSLLRQKKNYPNSNISPCKNIIFQKSTKRNQNPSRYYNSIITNLEFQHKPKYHL
jgi:hypothetical protein